MPGQLRNELNTHAKDSKAELSTDGNAVDAQADSEGPSATHAPPVLSLLVVATSLLAATAMY